MNFRKKKKGMMEMATREKRGWILVIFILSGLVIGGLLGELAAKVDWHWWLSFGQEFGIPNALTLNLGMLTLSFACMIKINIASIIGVFIAIFAYRKI